MITESKVPMDWERSRMICDEQKRRDKLHGHKVPFDQGDTVETRDGRRGIVIRKDYLYYSDNLKRDMWHIDIVFKSVIETFTNPASLRKVSAIKR